MVKNPHTLQETLVQFLGQKDPGRRDGLPTLVFLGFPGGSAGKESTCHAGDLGSTPGLGRSLEEEKGYPLQYSGLENSMNWILHGVTKSQTRLSNFHFHFSEKYIGQAGMRHLDVVSQLLSHDQFFATPWTIACQASQFLSP